MPRFHRDLQIPSPGIKIIIKPRTLRLSFNFLIKLHPFRKGHLLHIHKIECRKFDSKIIPFVVQDLTDIGADIDDMADFLAGEVFFVNGF